MDIANGPRSTRPEIRNPLRGLRSAALLDTLPEDSRAALRAVLVEWRTEAQGRGQRAYEKRKYWTSTYFHVIATYAGHLIALLKPKAEATPAQSGLY